MSELWVIAHVRAAPGKAAALRKALAGLLEPTRRERGCLSYELVASTQEPGDLAFIERWTDDAALDAHLKTPHVAACLAKAGPLLAAPPDVRRYRA